jgi:hypothetical protein
VPLLQAAVIINRPIAALETLTSTSSGIRRSDRMRIPARI